MSNHPESKFNGLEIGASNEDAALCVILMHGLGADGHDFEDVAQLLCQAAAPRKWRFLLPHATSIPVTINMGSTMPAWYDILELAHPRSVDWDTVATSQTRIESLIAAQSADRIILAGFSQGGAMALQVGLRHQDKIAGIVSMSGYLLESSEHPVPTAEESLPINILHGEADEVVPFEAAQSSLASLQAAGFSPSMTSYPGLGHSVAQKEIQDLYTWLEEHN